MKSNDSGEGQSDLEASILSLSSLEMKRIFGMRREAV